MPVTNIICTSSGADCACKPYLYVVRGKLEGIFHRDRIARAMDLMGTRTGSGALGPYAVIWQASR